MKNKYNSDFLESLHETAVGLNKIGVINDKEMREYDRDCLVPTPKTSSESTSVTVKPTPVYAESSRRS
ncbi:XRE family transcriptional regulator [Treponema sp. R80B11-R83G3]